MKNITVFITPVKQYDERTSTILKIWIENSVELGWNKEDLILINNFPWEYSGVKSFVVSDDNYVTFRPGSSKTVSISNLLETDFFKDEELYWIHDPDAFQMEVITHDEISNILGKADVGFTDYGHKPRWSMGSYFLRNTSKDIFKKIRETIFRREEEKLHSEDESALTELTDGNIENINQRIVRMNVRYNFGTRRLIKKWERAEKPIKVLHFRPFKNGLLDIYMYGKNELGFPIMNDRLRKVFENNGVK